MKQVTVEAPASSANLGPGFDVFALALSRPTDRIAVAAEKSSRLAVRVETVSEASITLNPRKNAASVAAAALAAEHDIRATILMKIWKGVPIGLGLGSSAASAAAAVVGVSELLGLHPSTDELVYFAGKGEEATAGTAHYDNVGAAIAGGFVIVRAGERPSIVSLGAPRNLSLVLVTPEVKLPARKTEYARSLLPRTTALRKMVGNVANASTMVAGFALGDASLIGRGMNDLVVEEARKVMIPGYDSVRSEAIAAGAVGICISGAGPTMLAAVDPSRTGPKRVLRAMVRAFETSGVRAEGFVTSVGRGARVVNRS